MRKFSELLGGLCRSGFVIEDEQSPWSGRQLYELSCITCHGQNLQGVKNQGPSLVGVGAAAAYFQVSTGRMPAKALDAEQPEAPRKLNPAETRAVAAYIQSLGGGPTVPTPAEVQTSGADLALGQQLFTADCAQCHNFDGAGGALTYGKYAPALTNATTLPSAARAIARTSVVDWSTSDRPAMPKLAAPCRIGRGKPARLANSGSECSGLRSPHRR